jgi:hypothetical protein
MELPIGHEMMVKKTLAIMVELITTFLIVITHLRLVMVEPLQLVLCMLPILMDTIKLIKKRFFRQSVLVTVKHDMVL